MATGTALHGLLRAYYGGKKEIDTTNIVYCQTSGDRWPIPNKAAVNAARVFRHYRVKFPPTELGRVVAQEVLYVAKATSNGWKPRNMEVTAKIDMEIFLTEKACSRLGMTRRLLLEPGHYIVDHKYHGQDWLTTNDKHVLSLQFPIYCEMWRARHPRQTLQGVLVNMLIDGNTPKFRTLFLRPPDENGRRLVLESLMQAGIDLHNRRYNAAACIDRYHQVCPHLSSGRCKRYPAPITT
jgi:hypothetical protein